MATCEGERFVAEQVASVLAGTRRPDEIVVVDDASTDATVAAVERALAAAPSPVEVRIERNRAREGAPLAFARGVRASSGDLVLFCDQDDHWLPGKVARTEAAFLGAPGTLLAYGDGRIVDEHLRDEGRTIFGTRARARLARGAARDPMEVVADPDVKGCTLGIDGSFARDLFARTDPSYARWWGHDHWAALFAHGLGGVVAIDEPLLLYRHHRGNQSFAERFDAASAGHWRSALRVARAQGHGFYERRYRCALGVARSYGDAFSPALRAALEVFVEISRRRREIGERSRPARLLPAARLWADGFYGRYYNGLLTLARDVLL